MIGDYSFGDLMSIVAMQGVSGLILFSVYLLMALGLAIIFGQMGVINMAHGEFTIRGAYMTYLTSHLVQAYIPSLYGGYFFVAMAVAFVVAGAAGFAAEWLLIRHLYSRPLVAIITQALAAVLTILIVGQQGYTGGINGITELRTLWGWDIRTDHAKYILYFVCCALLLGNMWLARFVRMSKLGRILVATRDKEDRVRFSGYDVANFKIFVFCLASAMAAVGGAMFTLQVGFMSPSFVGIVPSIEMVIFCAVGGRHSVVGAVVGTLMVNWGKTVFSEWFPELWLFAMGGLFIAVVLAFPRGLAGVVTDQIIPNLPGRRLWTGRQPSPAPAE